MQAAYTNTSTQTRIQTQPTPPSLILPLKPIDPLTLGNVPQKASCLVKHIMGNDLFTPEQKTFAYQWEGHFIQLLNHPNQEIPAKAVCFLGTKVITPSLMQYQHNRLASDQFIPIVRTQRELLTLLLPANTDVEGFISQCEDVYDLMLETTQKLNDITALNKETEQLLCQKATDMRETILSNSTQSSEMLRVLAKQWKTKIQAVNVKLTQLHAQAEGLNKKFQTHAQELTSIGTQLAAEQQKIQGNVNDLKKLLQKV